LTRDGAKPASRVALHALLAALREIDEHYLGAEEDPVAAGEGHRFLMHLLGGGLDLFFESDPEHPEFRPTLQNGRKFYGDNPDAVYHSATIRPDLEYRVRGNLDGAVYTSFTVEGGGGIDERYPPGRVVSTRSDAALEIAGDGSYELVASQDPRPGNWLPLAPDACSIVTRHYFEGIEAVDRRRRIPLEIEVLGPPANRTSSPGRPDSDSVARGIRRVTNFVRGLSIDYARNGPRLDLAAANRFGTPSRWDDARDPAVDQSNLTARFELDSGEVLLIEGRFPRCRFGNVVLWNRHLQTFEYRHRCASLNRKQTQLRPDGSFRIVVAHEDPGLPNWLDTAGARSGLIFVRYLLPEQQPEPLTTRVVALAELH
jgi:hypothetical protein